MVTIRLPRLLLSTNVAVAMIVNYCGWCADVQLLVCWAMMEFLLDRAQLVVIIIMLRKYEVQPLVEKCDDLHALPWSELLWAHTSGLGLGN